MKTTAQQVWETALGQLQLQVSRPSYETWLRDTVGLSIDQDFMTVGVLTPFAAEWLERRMYHLLQRTVGEVTRTAVHLQFQVIPPHQPNGANGNGVSPEVHHSQPTLAESNGSDASNSPRADNGNTPGINKRYTFDTFVVGKSNQLAHAAATAVAERPGEAYNPLFTYGGVGMGKTHIMHAIARDAAICKQRVVR
ncbi:MAG: DnaA/Hda family protein, partial [Chloroflexi bacterium]|nr:DnaA/Hda family protein [Chloroflexota bacterium]